MTFPTYRRRGTTDDPAADWAEALKRTALIADGRLIEVDMGASTAAQLFTHGLGRAYRGAMVVHQSGTIPVFVGPPKTSPDPALKLVLRMTTATAQRVALWVF